MASTKSAIAGKQLVLGDQFSMADGTPALNEYAARLAERPAAKRADARNLQIAKEPGLIP